MTPHFYRILFTWLLGAHLFSSLALAEPYTIGALLNLTGGGSWWGENARRGIELAKEEINAAGGIDGRPLVVLYEDTKTGDLKGSATAIQKLVSIKKVEALLTQWSAETEIAHPIAAAKNVLTISVSAGAPDLLKNRPLLLRTWGSDIPLLKSITDHLVTLNVERVGILASEDPYFIAMAGSLSEMLESKKRFQILKATIAPTENSLASTVLSLNNKSADILISLLYYHQQADLLKHSRLLRVPLPVIGIVGSDDPQFLKLSGSAADGIFFPAFIAPENSFTTSFQKRWGDYPWLSADTAYDAVQLVSIAAKAGARGGKALRESIIKNSGHEGASGRIEFSRDGDRVGRRSEIRRISAD